MKPTIFTLQKADSLLKPYATVLTIALLCSYFLLDDGSLLRNIAYVAYGNGLTLERSLGWSWVPLWFLPHLFLVYFFCYVLHKSLYYQELSTYLQFIVIISLVVLGSVSIDMFMEKEFTFFGVSFVAPGLPFSADILFLTSSFFLAGALFKRYIVTFSTNICFAFICFLLFIFISEFTNANISLNARIFTSPFLAMIAALCGIYLILTISVIINMRPWLSYIPSKFGSASLYILLFHSIIDNSVYRRLSFENEDIVLTIIKATVAFLLSLTLPLFLKRVIESNIVLSLGFVAFKNNRLLKRRKSGQV
ncbi:hypothetical protein BM524_07265 [Alteromonas mediterranea]|uniref:Acyltransferase 3 domain-containing protein n=1 Tax=Alteromonas mediterranea TaxID=314275 RepID=A0AAC9J940_9ALTE|nr:hypothetical protein BM524_07265 [Alteromonas mediterranea]